MKVGDRVRVKGKRGVAHIEKMLRDIKGGVLLDRKIDGYRFWNVKDLTAPKSSPKERDA